MINNLYEKVIEIKNILGIALIKIKARILEFILFFNNVETYAASLSLYTLSAIVPIIIVILSILVSVPNFKLQVSAIKNIILSNISPANTEVISSYLDQFMNNSKSLGMSAFIYALFASVLFFRNLENISSKLFESKKRTFFDALIVYWALMTLFPIGIGFSLYFSLEFQTILNKSHFANLINFMDFLPYISIWILFFILFKILSNKPLPFASLLLSSLITMIVWSVLKWAFMYYVFFNKAYSTIYGSFSIVMFFILWIYCSWIVVLYGMRLTQGFITNFGGKKDDSIMI
ncbi:YihY family inner membrane protein [Helicobacter sp. MIT 14-3879]|uniref:YihY family inner membrane protein n=1 Tax=Helicobacter sp. MIT 14-3879 TaxID=2040649 RepID=UPI0015F1290D|nr:YihY family inner membrane protein [Helicobacter sp. MIT 14-3879]